MVFTILRGCLPYLNANVHMVRMVYTMIVFIKGTGYEYTFKLMHYCGNRFERYLKQIRVHQIMGQFSIQIILQRI